MWLVCGLCLISLFFICRAGNITVSRLLRLTARHLANSGGNQCANNHLLYDFSFLEVLKAQGLNYCPSLQ